MKKWTHITVALVTALTLVACADDDPYLDDGWGEPAAGRPADSPDHAFVEDMLTGSSKGIEVSRLAEQQATHPEVKAFAQMMVKDHQQANDELRQIASQQNVQATASLEEVQDAREKLADKSGADFDRAYMDMMVEDHERVVKTVEGKINDAENPQVRQWASQTLPTLRQHLDRAREIQDKVGG